MNSIKTETVAAKKKKKNDPYTKPDITKYAYNMRFSLRIPRASEPRPINRPLFIVRFLRFYVRRRSIFFLFFSISLPNTRTAAVTTTTFFFFFHLSFRPKVRFYLYYRKITAERTDFDASSVYRRSGLETNTRTPASMTRSVGKVLSEAAAGPEGLWSRSRSRSSGTRALFCIFFRFLIL